MSISAHKPLSGGSARTALGLLAIAVLHGMIGWAGFALTRNADHVPLVWLPNALLVAVLLRTRVDHGMRYVGAGFFANLVIEFALGEAIPTSLMFATANAIEVLFVTAVVRRTSGERPQIGDIHTLARFAAMSLVGPAVSGTVAVLAVSHGGEGFDATIWLRWLAADGLGLMIGTPLVLIAIDAWATRHRPSRAELIEWTWLVLGTTLATTAIFAQTRYPFLFLACPIVVVAAFRTGMTGTAVAVALTSAVASIATYLGSGPIMLVHGDIATKLVALQLFLAVNFAIGLPVAAALASRNDLRRSLIASRDFKKRILDNVQDIIFQTDTAGRWVFLNPAWERVTGFTAEESIGWQTTRLLHPDDVVAATASYPALATGALDHAVLRQRFHRRDGECRHIEVTVRRQTDPDGRFIGMIGNIRDISDSIAQERALQESERRFQALANLAPAGIFRTDSAGHCNYVNDAWLRITGLAPGEWEGGGWATALHPDDLNRVAEGWAIAVARHEDYRAEFRWLHADGTVCWVDVMGRPEIDEAGDVLGFIGVTLDITERRRAEAELATRDEQLELLATNATDAVFRLTLDGHCLYASPSARDLLGVDPALLIGVNLLDRFHPDDEAEVTATFAALAVGEGEQRVIAYRSESISTPGTYRWLEANCGVVRDRQSGDRREIIASIRDVSVRKALEADLHEARARAEAAVTAKSAFLANMSHEIRTPMNGVIGFTELLLADDLPAEQRHHVQLIAESGRAMMRLLNDILDISKIESGQMRIADDVIDLRHVLRGGVRLMEPLARSKGVDLNVQIDPDIPRHIVSDALRLRQIVLNLIGNATKFTERGWIDLHASATVEAGTAMLRIDVRDSGVGIAADQLDLIFQQFVQADSSIARRFGGTGLGLPISADLARLMGGRITVASELGTGTTFTLLLPLVAAAVPEIVSDVAIVDVGPTNIVTHGPRVLIAEDHDINQTLIAAMARRAGMDPHIAVNGARAIEMVHAAAAADAPFALVLMDMQMPEVDGLEATRRLRDAGFDAATLPIVALTANAYADDVAACLAAGMQAHLSKPVRLRDLTDLAARYLTEATAPRDAVAEKPANGLAARFAKRRVDLLERVAEIIRVGALEDQDFDELCTMLHQFAGTAGFFGQAAQGRIAATLEHDLRSAGADGATAILDARWRDLDVAA